MEMPRDRSKTGKSSWKSAMRLKRSKSEDRQKLTETVDDQHGCSGSTPDEDRNCAQLFEADLQRIQFSGSCATATRPVIADVSDAVRVDEIDATCLNATSPLSTDVDIHENTNSKRVEDHRRGAASEAARCAVTSSDDTVIRRVDEVMDDVTITIHAVVDDDDSQTSLSSSPLNDASSADQCPLQAGRREDVQKTKKKNRRQKAKRFAKQTGVRIWRGVRFGAKVVYNGFVMLAATTNMNFNIYGGAASVWKQWSSEQDEQQRQQQEWRRQQFNRNPSSGAW